MDSLPEIGHKTRPALCPRHGAYEARNIMGRVWSSCPACVAEEAQARAEHERQQAQAALEDRHRRMLAAVRIPARFELCTFDNFVADTADKRHALTTVRDYAERFDDAGPQSLVLSGKPGTGKSHLAGAVLRHLMARHVRYITCLDMIRAVRETWRRDSPKTESQVLDYLGGLDLLVVDEVGMQYGTDGEQTIVFDVLDRRYRDMRPVILITNQDRDGFKAFVGDRVFDRLRETARWVAFDWPSYRGQVRRAA